MEQILTKFKIRFVLRTTKLRAHHAIELKKTKKTKKKEKKRMVKRNENEKIMIFFFIDILWKRELHSIRIIFRARVSVCTQSIWPHVCNLDHIVE